MGLIRGRIIHNNQFEICAGLIQYALDGLCEVTGLPVERRDDDTDSRCGWGHWQDFKNCDYGCICQTGSGVKATGEDSVCNGSSHVLGFETH